ncbi:MAG TPA: STAS domain-containing protein, partial [Pseudomonadales bacterium]|nr:STAS domain-containing protein [Pseudomonadales bacterium]
DVKVAGAIRKTITDMVPQYTQFIVDFSKTNLVDSGGLAGLVMLQKFVKVNNCKLVLCHLSKTVNSMFEMTRMDKVFKLAESVETATNTLADH